MASYEKIQSQILGPGAGFWRPSPHALVRVAGPDAADYLHRLCSQDVVAMSPGDVRPACFLDGKGRLLQNVLLARVEDGLWVQAQAHKAKELWEMLELYHFSEELTLETQPEAWECAEVWSPTPLAEPAPGRSANLQGDGMALCWQRQGLTRFVTDGNADLYDCPLHRRHQADRTVRPDRSACILLRLDDTRRGEAAGGCNEAAV